MSFHFFPICHQLSPSSHFQHLKISFCFIFPSSPGSSPSSRPFQFLKNVQNLTNYIGGWIFIKTAVITSYIRPYTNTTAHNPQCAGTMHSATRYHVACRGIWNEKMSINPYPGKDELGSRSNFEILYAFCLRRHALLTHFVNMTKNRDTLAWVVYVYIYIYKSVHFLLHMLYRKIYSSAYNFIRIYLFFILNTEFYVACRPTTSCRISVP